MITDVHNYLNNITSKMRSRRETMNYTQAYVAGKLGISQNAYSKIESGQTNFTVRRLYEIVHILEASIFDFLQ
ncbi:MAG TPA: helix-turn-helix transcriptional regulator [Parafilimonas sp.]|nr:helix-turn-helix transcriptional regulator [Parafilimonas sp.]